jgi:protein-tyrosine kinase
MNGRTGLIERAAALLRDTSNPTPAPVASIPSEGPSSIPVTISPLARQVVLDRAHLARVGIIMPWTSTSRIVEEYRIIKRNIMASWQSPDTGTSKHQPRIVMVTSARPREGKTFSSINLALAFAAEENLVTVLVDADTVRQDTAKTLAVPEEPGFTDVLAGHRPLADVLIQSDIPNLLLLPSGPSGAHIPELLAGPAPGALFEEIADRYPHPMIILDTPPCLASTDPAALASISSQIVFVVEAEHTQRPEVESALSLISDCPRISFLLNLIPVGASEHFGSYSYYYQPQKSGDKT